MTGETSEFHESVAPQEPHGISIVVTHSEPGNFSRETTFERDLHAVRDRTSIPTHAVDERESELKSA